MGNLFAPLKKFASNKHTVTVIGVLLGVVVIFLGYQWRVNQAISPVNIYFAKRTIPQGDTITADDIGVTQISSTILKNMKNVVQNQDQIEGMMVSFDSKIPLNSYFFQESLIAPEEMPDSLFSNIPDGYTIYALDINNMTSYGNSIFPNDSIDLYLHTTDSDNEGKVIFGKFIKSIQVLAVKDSSGRNVFRDRDNVGTPSVLLFSVPEDLFLLLTKAKYVGMDIVAVPRNASYSLNREETVVESEYLKNFILAKTVQIPDENIE